MNDLRWHPQPGIRKNHEMPVHDGWRDLGGNRRWRVAFDLDRYERRMGAVPRLPQFNIATDQP
jgi:hypothetical protein